VRAIIVDDEVLLVNELKKLLAHFGDIEIVGDYTDPNLAYTEIDKSRPDIAFLDIEMAGMNGIDLAERILEKFSEIDIIFVTAYNYYAAEAFETNAMDYILKPVRLERIQKALEKINKRRHPIRVDDSKPLRIQSFGKFGVYLGEVPLKWSRAKQQELFAYLLQHEGQWIDKYKICDELWTKNSPEQALANLQTAVWALRKLFKDTGVSNIKINYSNDSYILYIKEVVWDVKQFCANYQLFKDTRKVEAFDSALKIYREGYLFYNDWLWAIIEQGKYASIHMDLIRLRDGFET